MHNHAVWQEELLAALDWSPLINPSTASAAQFDRELIRPTAVDAARAVANIRAWRSYLPEDCVNAMINDGWQWST